MHATKTEESRRLGARTHRSKEQDPPTQSHVAARHTGGIGNSSLAASVGTDRSTGKPTACE